MRPALFAPPAPSRFPPSPLCHPRRLSPTPSPTFGDPVKKWIQSSKGSSVVAFAFSLRPPAIPCRPLMAPQGAAAPRSRTPTPYPRRAGPQPRKCTPPPFPPHFTSPSNIGIPKRLRVVSPFNRRPLRCGASPRSPTCCVNVCAVRLAPRNTVCFPYRRRKVSMV